MNILKIALGSCNSMSCNLHKFPFTLCPSTCLPFVKTKFWAFYNYFLFWFVRCFWLSFHKANNKNIHLKKRNGVVVLTPFWLNCFLLLLFCIFIDIDDLKNIKAKGKWSKALISWHVLKCRANPLTKFTFGQFLEVELIGLTITFSSFRKIKLQSLSVGKCPHIHLGVVHKWCLGLRGRGSRISWPQC